MGLPPKPPSRRVPHGLSQAHIARTVDWVCVDAWLTVVVWLQAPGFGDGEAFTDKTFTDKAYDGNNLMLEEMEVFAVSGYP